MRLILLAAIGLGGMTAAAAEPPIGSRLGNRLTGSAQKFDEAAAARSAHSAARCVVGKRRAAAERLLAATDAEALQRAHRSIWSGQLTCYSGFEDGNELVEGRRIATPLDIERGLIAEQLLRQLDQRVSALPPLPLRQGYYRRTWFGGTGRDPVVDEMGACLGDTAPQGIRSILRTDPYTPEEKQAFGALTPVMGKCLSAGAKLTGNRQSVRAALADALYQRVLDPAASLQVIEQAKH